MTIMKKITKVFDTQSDWVSKVFIALMAMVGMVLFVTSVMAIQLNRHVWWLVPIDLLFLWGVLHSYIRDQFQWYENITDKVEALFAIVLLFVYLSWDYIQEEYEKIQTYQFIVFFFFVFLWAALIWIMFNQT